MDLAAGMLPAPVAGEATDDQSIKGGAARGLFVASNMEAVLTDVSRSV
eukprot:gene17659-24006_t